MTSPMQTSTTDDVRIHRLAAPAPTACDDDDDIQDPSLTGDTDLHALCEQWSFWCRSRRLFAQPSMPISLLGKLTSRTRPVSSGGPDARCDPMMAAFHLAVQGQPRRALDRQVFELHYLWRVRNVKAAASAVGISRQHWYRLVRDFRARAYSAAVDIQRDNLEQARELQHGRPLA